jgi:SAM-dependent methyltransferase
MSTQEQVDFSILNDDKYVYGMDWTKNNQFNKILGNYRKYQFNLIKDYIGSNILEIGSGDRGFTNEVINNVDSIERLVSIEPSETLFDLHKNNFDFPDLVQFYQKDLFDLKTDTFRKFDTVIFIHVLEHIKKDRKALTKASELISQRGFVLIEVPALPFLFSVHDKMLGHYRRYNKKSLLSSIPSDIYNIIDIWYQDPIGVIGSLIYFKILQVRINSDLGGNFIESKGSFYDSYLIPLQGKIEKYIRFPFGLSLTAILQKK